MPETLGKIPPADGDRLDRMPDVPQGCFELCDIVEGLVDCLRGPARVDVVKQQYGNIPAF
ncbi:MAG: hypothetical protein JW950_05125 [Deltaproteobacteria bacterium]|nr:hypothetical protein [Deltaproteobacteria bacterium]